MKKNPKYSLDKVYDFKENIKDEIYDEIDVDSVEENYQEILRIFDNLEEEIAIASEEIRKESFDDGYMKAEEDYIGFAYDEGYEAGQQYGYEIGYQDGFVDGMNHIKDLHDL